MLTIAMISTKPFSATALSLLILTGSMSLGSFSNVEAQTSNLFVSANNSFTNNLISGPQVVEVVIRDQNISNTGEGKGEPDVTVNGKDLRLIQATDGNLYQIYNTQQ